MLEEHGSFAWDPRKERINIIKHRIDFTVAAHAFKDPKRKIFADITHSGHEERYFCIGKVNNKIVTVRFTRRGDKIKIIVAGYCRKGRRYYEEA